VIRTALSLVKDVRLATAVAALVTVGGLVSLPSVMAQSTAPPVHACAATALGTLRQVGTPKECNTTLESVVSWNVPGPQGPQGRPGPIGPMGRAGGSGPRAIPFAGSGVRIAEDTEIPPTRKTVASVLTNPGRYLVVATVAVGPLQNRDGFERATCSLDVGPDRIDVQTVSETRQVMTLHGAATIDPGTTRYIQVWCVSHSVEPQGSMSWFNARITTVNVTDVTLM
jgi:hypothetical protein